MIIDTNNLPAGLSGSAIKALCHLYESGDAPLGEIARIAGNTTAAVTGLIDRLETEGLVARATRPDDRRVVLACLTASGREFVENFRPGKSYLTLSEAAA